ncbi:MAG: DUF4405 domain-containing protein [Clostridia bacterium]|nr:DUF4405 domain-containing protein [Clostridia bacterium]
MKPIRIMKILLDILMYVLFLLLMGQHLASSALHEWLGVGLFVCFLAHNILNYRWYKALFKGKYTVQRSVQTAINFLLMLSFIGCMLSALMISGVVFQDFRIPGMMMFGRKLHMTSTAWCFVFMSLHLGMHIRAPKKTAAKIGFYTVMTAASLYGIYHFIIRKFYEELFLLTEFKWFDYDKTLPVYLFETLCISLAFVMLTFIFKKITLYLKEKRKHAK